MTINRTKIINTLMKHESLNLGQLSDKSGLKKLDVLRELMHMSEVEKVSQGGIVVLKLSDTYNLPKKR